jgi:hypothetical protein
VCFGIICEASEVLWVVLLVVTAVVSLWAGRRVVSLNAPHEVSLSGGSSARPVGLVRLQSLLLALAMVTAYVRERGMERTHVTSWLFGWLAAYLPFFLVISVHNARVRRRLRNDLRER